MIFLINYMIHMLVLQFNFPYQPISWTVYCIIMALYFNAWFILAMFKWGSKPWYPRGTNSRAKYFIFASNWGYMAACAYLTLRAISTLMFHVNSGFQGNEFNVLIHITQNKNKTKQRNKQINKQRIAFLNIEKI